MLFSNLRLHEAAVLSPHETCISSLGGGGGGARNSFGGGGGGGGGVLDISLGGEVRLGPSYPEHD